MSFKSYLNESKDKKMKMGDTVVILTGKTMMKADLKHYKVLVPWTDEQKKKREKLKLGEPYDGLTQWIAEDQLKEV